MATIRQQHDPNKTTHSDASLHAAAIARWDDDASTPLEDKPGVKAVEGARSKRTAEMLAALKDNGVRRTRTKSRHRVVLDVGSASRRLSKGQRRFC